VYNTIAIEDLGKPTVALCNQGFLNDARSAASGKGMPKVRLVSETVPCECSVMQEIDTGVSLVMDDIITALTKPLTAEEKSPKKEVEKSQRIVFKGNLEEVNRFFYKRGWTDGLPIIPPTEEAVAEMLTGTDLPPDHVVTKLIPRMGKATVEKIAINAVMAGALPTYMPVLIAGVKALMDTKAVFGTWEVSTGSWAPCWIVNGPIRNDLRVNCSSGVLSPGDIANAAIGRAIGLIVKNIGGARKGIEDMGVLGNPGKYSLVLGEYEEESPWESLQVERGFKKEDNTLTVFFPNTYTQTFTYGTDAKAILSTLIYNIEPGRQPEGLACFIITPQHARILANEGWGKKEVKAFISENATAPFYRHSTYWGVVAGTNTSARQLPTKLPFQPQDPIRLIQNTDCITIVVAGGPGAFLGFLRGSGGGFGNSFVTHKIELPANWSKLVEKYKGMTPTHTLY
jgi:hypothetical protein